MTGISLSKAGDGKTSNQPRVGKMKMYVNNKEYWIHPVYDLYGANRQGEVINITKSIPMKGRDHHSGYTKSR